MVVCDLLILINPKKPFLINALSTKPSEWYFLCQNPLARQYAIYYYERGGSVYIKELEWLESLPASYYIPEKKSFYKTIISKLKKLVSGKIND